MTGPGSGWVPPQGGAPGEPAGSGPPTAAAWYPQGAPQPAPTGVGFGQPPRDYGPPPVLAPPPPPPPRRGMGGGRLAALVGVIALVVVGAVVAVVLATTGGSPDTSPTQVAATGPTTPDFPTTASDPTYATTPTAPATTAPPTVPATTALPSVSSTGIDIAAIGSNPHAIPVTKMFDTYFSGINAHDATTATSVYAPGNKFDRTNPTQIANFNEDISTTNDTAIVIRSITSTAAGLDVDVTFTSTQAPDLGPDDQACTNWHIVYHLVPVGTGVGILKASADYTAC